jgi:hypothetical protein
VGEGRQGRWHQRELKFQNKNWVVSLSDLLPNSPMADAWNSPSTLNLADSLWRVSRDVDKPVAEAIRNILAKAKAHGVVAGIHNGELLAWFHEGRLRPYISATYPLERATDALNDVMNRKVMDKVVLIP